MTITLDELKALIHAVSDRDTSAVPSTWSADNPLWGHCRVASCIVQKMFGGELLTQDLAGTKYAPVSHYSNCLPDGTQYDLTESQFDADFSLVGIEPKVRPRAYALDAEKSPKNVARYKLLYWRVMGALNPDNPLFRDEMYRECFFAALDSDCAKMHFGCVFVDDGKIVHTHANKKIPAIAHRCQPECCRNTITSRPESRIGACSHAEEGLWAVANMGIKPKEVEMYIAGFQSDMTPWLKTEAEHTCIRCATPIHLAGIRAVHIPINDHWEALDLATMLDTAFSYAVGEKKV
jgi:deoxycytidylate deaminase